MKKRFIYALAGSLVASAIGLAFRAPAPFMYGIPVWGAALTIAWAERTGRVRTVEELNKPISLFGAKDS
jgi:hypothetical protein